uniref:Uncharacterized protein n=1 Tax=Kalanchoe fedtschenkoi TaxID=63787 RepID=A0A7N0U019_KALFE
MCVKQLILFAVWVDLLNERGSRMAVDNDSLFLSASFTFLMGERRWSYLSVGGKLKISEGSGMFPLGHWRNEMVVSLLNLINDTACQGGLPRDCVLFIGTFSTFFSIINGRDRKILIPSQALWLRSCHRGLCYRRIM